MNTDQFYADIANNIRDYGFHMVGVFGTRTSPGPSFTYTIGFAETHGFELICIGLPCEFAAQIFHSINEKLNAGETIQCDVPDGRWANLPSMFKKCKDAAVREYAVQAWEFYKGQKKQLKFLQLVMPDKNGKFPHEAGYDIAYMGPRQNILY